MGEQKECFICLNPLPSSALACLLHGGSRICRHVLHLRCAADLLRAGIARCPVCRAEYDQATPIPALRKDPAAWFHAVDFNDNGSLSRQEITDALAVTLPLNQDALESFVEKHWSSWDRNGTGEITERDFLAHESGMLAKLLLTLGQLCYNDAPPDINHDPAAWFFHYAGDKGFLLQEEFTRGVMQTLSVPDSQDITAVRASICEVLWGRPPLAQVTYEEFVEVGSLRDTVLMQLPAPAAENRQAACVPWCPETVRVLRGVELSWILVGSETGNEAFAQNPPAQGDSWEVDFESDGGAYEVCFYGGGNAHHGILSVYIDDVLVGEVDQYECYTTYPTRHVLQWEGGAAGSAGKHTLRGTVTSKARRSLGYWFCLIEISFMPIDVDEVGPLRLDAAGSHNPLRRVSTMSLSTSLRSAWGTESDDGASPMGSGVLSRTLSPSGTRVLGNVLTEAARRLEEVSAAEAIARRRHLEDENV